MILRRASEGPVDLLWIDKGLAIRPDTLLRFRSLKPQSALVFYSPDDMGNPVNQSLRYLESIPLYDLHVTTKSYNCEELRDLGARDVLFVNNAYDPAVHRKFELAPAEREQLAASVGFIGYFENDRADHIRGLARAGLAVTVRGPGWRKLRGAHQNLRIRESYLEGMEYSKAINATLINLAFLRKANRDLQTTRSIEIPACGAFMLAERTDEHLRLFSEGKEAEFFGSFDELLAKCQYYLTHPIERERISAAGLRRCVEGDYSNKGMLRRVLQHLGME
jgi:spore maturation protein CgeB